MKLRADLGDDCWVSKGAKWEGGGEAWECIDETEGPRRRWSSRCCFYIRNVASGRIYEYPWERGHTESQENEYYLDEIREVTRTEEQVTVTKVTYIPVQP